MLLKGVEGDAVAGVARPESVRFSLTFLSFNRAHSPCASDAKWCCAESPKVFDETSHGPSFGRTQIVFLRESCEEWVELLLTEVGVFKSETLQLLNDERVP